MNTSILGKFIETELNAYIQDQRLTDSPLMVKLISKAFEAYDEYKRLVSTPPYVPFHNPQESIHQHTNPWSYPGKDH